MTSNSIQPFDFKGTPVRAFEDVKGNRLFCAKDVAEALGYTNTNKAIGDHVRGVTNRYPITDSLGREQQAVFIGEGDLYRLIASSKLPSAQEFESWIFDTVVPSIRKHGGYMAGQEHMTPEQMALASMRWLNSKVEEQARQLEAQKSQVLFAKAVEVSRTNILVGDLAKILKSNGVDIGSTRLFAWMRDRGYLMKSGMAKNMPTQRSMDLGLFHVKETTIVHADGHTTINKTPKVTGKGQTYFINKFLTGSQEVAA
ncbi:MAG: phage antirepressor KilAC domain-containing protein [Bifidobacterium mongoliense]|uniref:phage antirepressor KilAC domain-containing protein n=1 Tax=Bifidobacterium mongoliense TaxID=518643 RepID=UPI002F351084